MLRYTNVPTTWTQFGVITWFLLLYKNNAAKLCRFDTPTHIAQTLQIHCNSIQYVLQNVLSHVALPKTSAINTSLVASYIQFLDAPHFTCQSSWCISYWVANGTKYFMHKQWYTTLNVSLPKRLFLCINYILIKNIYIKYRLVQENFRLPAHVVLSHLPVKTSNIHQS